MKFNLKALGTPKSWCASLRKWLFGSDHWLKVLIKLVFTGLVFVAAYAIYLDSKLQQAFAEVYQPHVLNVQSRPLLIKPGIRLSITELQQELQALNYQSASSLTALTNSNTHTLGYYRRGNQLTFQSTERDSPHLFEVSFEESRVVNLKKNNQRVDAVELAPVVLDRIWAGTREDRIWVDIEQVPEQLIELLLLVEDRNFYQHWGVNPIAIGRALVANIQAGQTVQGGSTLTQQLAKNLLLSRQRSLVRKINEALLALLMELRYSKEQILEAYINEIYMGQLGATAIHGFATASEFYFAKPLQELNLEQQVALVAMVKGPSLYNPWRRPDVLAKRRDLVLRMLLEREQLDVDLYQRIIARPVAVVAKRKLQLKQRPAIVRSVRSDMQRWISGRYQGQLQAIETTIDPLSQTAMEAAVPAAIQELEQAYKQTDLQVAMIAIDANSGAVRALVSDRQPDYPGYNRVIDAKRPIGSLLKPVILLAGLQHKADMSLATSLNDRPVSMRSSTGKRWQPQNFDQQYRGSVAALNALAKSLNVPFVNLGMSVGLDNIEQLLGSLTGSQVASLYPSDLLGSMSMSPWQIAQLYGTLANQGRYQPLYLVDGARLTENRRLTIRPPYQQQALDVTNVYQVMYAMQQVVKSGTARYLNGQFAGVDLAAKTGTSNDYRDAWFVAVDGRELVVVWVGRDDNQPIKLTGSQAAMQVYRHYLKRRGAIPLQIMPPAEIEFVPVIERDLTLERVCENALVLPVDSRKNLPEVDCVKKTPLENDSVKPWWKRIFG